MIIDYNPTVKQDKVMDLFNDQSTMEILYGGSAGSGKSIMLCSIIILKCLQHPGIRVGLSRIELTTLKKTTLISFFEVCNMLKLERDRHFNYNSVDGTITFTNTSQVVLIELRKKPSDPEYTRLGGLLLTFACIDELGDVPWAGYDILSTRVGRWINEETGIKPLMISTANPVKTWVYNYFYKRDRDNLLPPHVKFIQSLPTDNPYLPKDYIESLKRKDKITVERLLKGNWEYNDSDLLLFKYDNILDFLTVKDEDESTRVRKDSLMRTNVRNYNEPRRYMSVDVARLGKDRTVIWVMNEFNEVVDFYSDPQTKINEIVITIQEMSSKWNVKMGDIAIDSDGVGGGVVDYLPGTKSIVNNSRPIGRRDINFQNLKTQLIFTLSEMINNNKLKMLFNLSTTVKEDISQELSIIERVNIEKDTKFSITPKDKIKEKISRSPDYLDSLCYLMLFKIKSPQSDPIAMSF